MVFGYMNQNWAEEFDIPIGPDNNIEPGGPDQRSADALLSAPQPVPRSRSRCRRTSATRKSSGRSRRTARSRRPTRSLKNDYMIDNQVISTEVGGDFGSLRDELRTNIPPELKVDGDKQRTRQGRHAADADGVREGSRQHSRAPRPRRVAGADGHARRLVSRAFVARAGERTRPAPVVDRLSRHAADVTFSPEQMKTWTDTRATPNSPWSPPYFIPEPPPDNKWIIQATFHEAGQRTCLRAVASDGAVFTLRQRHGHRDAIVRFLPGCDSTGRAMSAGGHGVARPGEGFQPNGRQR